MGFEEFFCFRIEDVRLGIPLHHVDRIIRSVAVSLLPNPPRIVHGLIDYYGTVVPVINLRRRLALKEKTISPDQIFVMVDTSVRKLALVADSADEVAAFSASELIPSVRLDSGIEASGVYKTNDGILLIYDPEKFLSTEEEIQLEASIQSEQRRKTNQ
jgi:purine-binding chemotaxis protein CheW